MGKANLREPSCHLEAEAHNVISRSSKDSCISAGQVGEIEGWQERCINRRCCAHNVTAIVSRERFQGTGSGA